MKNKRLISVLALTVFTYSPSPLYAMDDAKKEGQSPRSVEPSPRTSLSLRKLLSSPGASKALSPKEFKEKWEALKEAELKARQQLNRLLEEDDRRKDYEKREAELKAQREARENLSRSLPFGATTDKPANVARLDLNRAHSFAGRSSMTPDSLRRSGATQIQPAIQSARTLSAPQAPGSDPMPRVATSRSTHSFNKPDEDDPATKQAVEKAIRLSLTTRFNPEVDPLQKVIEESLTPRCDPTPRVAPMPQVTQYSYDKSDEDDQLQEAIRLSLTPELTSQQNAQHSFNKPDGNNPETKWAIEEAIRLSLEEETLKNKTQAKWKEEKKSLIEEILSLNDQVIGFLGTIQEIKEKEISVSQYFLNPNPEKQEQERQTYQSLLSDKETSQSRLFQAIGEKNSRIQDYFLKRKDQPSKKEKNNQRREQKKQLEAPLNDFRSTVITLRQKVIDKSKERKDALNQYLRQTAQEGGKDDAWNKYMITKDEEGQLFEELYQASKLESAMAAQYFAFVQDKGAILPINMAEREAFEQESKKRAERKEEKKALGEQILGLNNQVIALRHALPELAKKETEAFEEYRPHISEQDSEEKKQTQQKWWNLQEEKDKKTSELSQSTEETNRLVDRYFTLIAEKPKGAPPKDQKRREEKEQQAARLKDVRSQTADLRQKVKDKTEASEAAREKFLSLDTQQEEKDRAWEEYGSLSKERDQFQQELDKATAQESEMIIEYFNFVRKKRP